MFLMSAFRFESPLTLKMIFFFLISRFNPLFIKIKSSSSFLLPPPPPQNMDLIIVWDVFAKRAKNARTA